MKQLASSIVYENPLPQLRAINSVFPWFCELPDGRLLAAHQMGQAFESVDGTTCLSESADGGRSWSKPRRVFDKASEPVPLTDCAKLTLLPDGRLILLGYEYFRPDPEKPIGNPETGGLLDDQIFYSVSNDLGRTWSERSVIPCVWGRHAEASAPLTVLRDGSWATPITGFADWNGVMSARNCGRLLRSYDQGRTWNDDTICLQFPGDGITCYEQRLCQLENGAIVVIGWNEDTKTGQLLNNHVAISTDNGLTFGEPIDTGIHGQASSILHLGGNRVLSLHALRRDTPEPGICACVADLSDGKWNVLSVEKVWSPASAIVKNTKMADVFAYLKFGQPGAIRLKNGDVLMSHWVCEEGCYKTLCTRFRPE